MLIRHNPSNMAQAASVYSQGVEAPPGVRWLYVSGQVGVLPNGQMADGVEAQMEQAWRNVLAVLADGGMAITDVVKLSAFLLRADDYPSYNRMRTRMLGEARPASTAIILPALAKPEWLFEIEAIAACA